MRLKDVSHQPNKRPKRWRIILGPLLLTVILTVILTVCGINAGTAARIGIMTAALLYAALECRAIYRCFQSEPAAPDALNRFTARTVGNGNAVALGCIMVYACIRALFTLLFLIAAMSCFEATAIAAEVLTWLAFLCLVTLVISIPTFCVHNRRGNRDEK